VPLFIKGGCKSSIYFFPYKSIGCFFTFFCKKIVLPDLSLPVLQFLGDIWDDIFSFGGFIKLMAFLCDYLKEMNFNRSFDFFLIEKYTK